MLFVFFLLLSAAAADLSGDRAALLALRLAVGGRTFLWNVNLTTPCNWQGVQCEGNRVTAVRLPGASLLGEIPVNTVSNLTALRTLSLRFNRLSGPLPDDIAKLTELRNLYLLGNQFSGSIPVGLLSLQSLVRLDLSSNSFSGEIPSGFNNLTHLRTLNLENNRFSGSLPDIGLQLDQFNVSFNNLNGSVPRGLQEKPRDAFLGNSLCGRPLDVVCPNVGGEVPSPSPEGNGNGNGSGNSGKSGKKKLSGGAIAGIVIGSAVGLLLLLLVLFILCRKRGGNKARSMDMAAIKSQENEAGEKSISEAENGGTSNGFSVAAAAAAAMRANATSTNKGEAGGSAGDAKKLIFFGNSSRVFDLEELLRASAEVLGKGTFGTSYKAVLEVGTVVAVKRLKDVVCPEKEFKEKIEGVGAMDHENLVPLRAYYYSREEKLLVYDYMPMGSLSALLHGNKGAGRTPFTWEIISGIALGTARGIEYLHFHGPNVSHGNIKSSNILLTKSYDARVSDFGLNHLVGPPSSPNRVSGYRAPEVTEPRRSSQKSDVYSFGVLLLELLTGKPPSYALLNEEGVDLPRWVQSIVREDWTSKVFDPQLLQNENIEDEMVQLLQLGIDCTAQFPDQRPSISDVANLIEELRRSSSSGYSVQPDRVTESN